MSQARSIVRTYSVAVAVVLSAALHITLVSFGARWARLEANRAWPTAPAVAAAKSSDDTVEIELPSVSMDKDAAESPVPVGAEVAHAGGLDTMPRPDTGRSGKGGTDTSASPAVNLADRDDAIRLSPEIASRIDRDQIQRLSTSKARKSFQDGRYTTNPMEMTFLASGKGSRMERRVPAEMDPSSGVLRAPTASVRGVLRLGMDAVAVGDTMPFRPTGGGRVGTSNSSPGQGVIGGAPGQDHRASAAVASARPMVRQGSPSIPSNDSGRPQDTKDSSQEVATAVQSILHASTAGGRPGSGPGGSQGAGATGSGGTDGPGSRSDTMGQGGGGYYGMDGYDSRLSNYRRRVMARLWPLWEDAFPRWAIAELRQGLVIISVTILSDGSVANAVVKRASGIPEFDTKCMLAVRKASPFEPIPANLGVSRMQWDISFEASNPAVR